MHGCEYLLQESSIRNTDTQRYYRSKEAQSGVKLTVAENGSITVNGGTSDYYHVDADNTSGHVALKVENPKVAVFSFTKAVAGNMGDLTGNFIITMEVYEPDDITLIDTKTVTLRKGEGYSSEQGKKLLNGTYDNSDSCAFGKNAIPKGALLKIKEVREQDYEAVVKDKDTNVVFSNAKLVSEDERSEVWLRLTEGWEQPATFVLINNKDVAIDVGVVLEQNAPYAIAAIAIPAVWLYLRARRRRKGGDER